MLVIADHLPRPGFSAQESRTLAELAGVLARRMELRLVASQMLDAEIQLRETGRRFRGFADAAPVMLLYCGSDGSCEFVNQAWLDFAGRKPADEMGAAWVELVHPDYRDRVAEICWQSFQARRRLVTEVPLRRVDGQYRWMLGKGAPRFRDDGSFDG